MTNKIVGGIFASIVGLIGLTVLLGSWYTIDASERGVLLRNGAVVGVAHPGLGFKLPIADSVERISLQTKTLAYEGVTAYSSDTQPATMRVSVTYRVQPDAAIEVYTMFGGDDALVSRIISPMVNRNMETVFGTFKADRAIRERDTLNKAYSLAMNEAIGNRLIVIEGVQIENIDFSDAFEASVEQRAKAEVEVATEKQKLDKETIMAQIVVTQAQAAADSNLAKAKAEAEGKVLLGEAEAKAIEARGKALRDNPSLVGLITAERWNGVLPTSIPPNGSVPFLNVSPVN